MDGNTASAFFAGTLATILYLRATSKPTAPSPWKTNLLQLLSPTHPDPLSLPLSSLRTPAYLLYLDVAQANATTMLDRARSLGCLLRPHVKTHKTLQGAYLQTGGTMRRIVCSTLAECRYFSSHGFDDLLYAVPITPDKLPEARRLSTTTPTFSILVDNLVQLHAILAAPPPSSSRPWRVVIMVDCGYGRDGIVPVDAADSMGVRAVKLLRNSSTCTFAGLYTHGGHSYDEASVDNIRKVAVEERDKIVLFSNIVLKHIPALQRSMYWVGVGSTPTCSKPPLDGLRDIDEMHPGNYFVYDCTQTDIGSCAPTDIATRVLTRVIGHYHNDTGNMLLIDLGWTGTSAQGSGCGYGRFEGHPELYIHALKQEAGEVVSSQKGVPLELTQYPIGSFLKLMPHHACASGAMHAVVNVVRNEHSEVVVDQWRPCRGW